MGKFPIADAKLKKQLVCRKCKTKNKVGAERCRKCNYKFLRPKKTTVVKK
ncbi:MAG: 50S ribosomal protein L40e [Candidatus Micrarchaeia archaeon]